MRKVILFALVGIALSVASYGVYETQSRKQTMSDILLANIEALGNDDPETMQCIYLRNESKCSVYVGAKGSIKILNGTILTAGADGYIIFDGKVTCSKGGEESCRNIECIDIYERIF